MIRQLNETDLPEMAELYVSVFASEPWNEQWKLSVVHERLTQFLTGRNSLAYGCFESNRLVGFVLGEHLPYLESRHFYIREMCVDSALHGTGIGSKLWNYLEDQVKPIGVTGIILETERGTPAEEKFYRKMGCGESERIVFMYKRLG